MGGLRQAARRRGHGERGQTLLFSMIAIVILMVGTMIVFDLQSTVRGKVKSQTAVDAAALAGANWQKESLNLIGELNLVKACTVLISDPTFGIGGDTSTFMRAQDLSELPQAVMDTVRLAATAQMLSEMQSRVSFVGPLIGLGAAQQAAKNNGLNYNESWGRYASEHYARVCSEGIYGNPDVLSQTIQGYEWRVPYAEMLYQVLDYSDGTAKGFAVNPNKEFLGYPRVYTDPPCTPDFSSYLSLKSFYLAINADYWCALRYVIRMEFGDKWWGDLKVDQDSSSFPEESEYLPLHIDFFTGSAPYDQAADSGALDSVRNESRRGGSLTPMRDTFEDDEDPYLFDPETFAITRNSEDTDDRFAPLPRIAWAVFDTNWMNYFSDMTDTWSIYLRSSFNEGHDYFSGAVSYMQASVEPTLLTGNWNMSKEPDSAPYLGDAMSFGGTDVGGQQINAYGQKLKSAESSIREMNRSFSINASSLAKPYGRIVLDSGGYLSPMSAAMVLPVFDKSALIPVSLEKPMSIDAFDDFYYFVTEYLPVLGTVDNIDDMPGLMQAMYPDDWAKMYQYHLALTKLDDPEWRARGIAWLDAEVSGHDEYDSFGNVTGHVVDTTNEDYCDYWPSGGSGTRSGPGTLH